MPRQSTASGGAEAARPLADVVVVETGQGVAVAFCGKLLADFGATVIKVEHPRGGDHVRGTAPSSSEDEGARYSALRPFLDANKLGVTANLHTHSGRQLLKRLTDSADVLATFAARGEDADDLLGSMRAGHPRLIDVTLSWFGCSGPWQSFACDDFLAQHVSGMAFSTAVRVEDPAQSPPLATQGHLAEMAAGLTAATAVMTALTGREADGGGAQIDISIVEALTSFLRQEVVTLSYGVGLMSRRKEAVSRFAGVFQQPTGDGYVDILIRTEASWRALMEAIGSPDWASDELFSSHPSRALYWDALEPLLQQELRRFTSEYLHREGQRRGVAIARVNTVADALASPQFANRGFFVGGGDPEFPEFIYPGPPFRLATDTYETTPAPRLGQHNVEVLVDWLGLTTSEFRKLEASGVI